MAHLTFMLMILFLVICTVSYAVELGTITPSQSIGDGTTMVSGQGRFELGFFSPGSSKNRYLGIWYKNIPVPTVVWVTNRCNPINGSSGLLTLNNTGNLVLLDQNKSVVWSTRLLKQAKRPKLELLDSGNLVVREEDDTNSENYLWQSFDYPSNTLLPGMKLGWDLRTGLKRFVSSWKNWDDPCSGDFTWGIEIDKKPHEFPESVMRKGSVEFFRSGPWNGLTYSGAASLRPNPLFNYSVTSNDDEVFYTYNLLNKSVNSRIVMNGTTSTWDRSIWIESDQSWKSYFSIPADRCDSYGLCGAYGNCIISSSPICQCLKGFKPKSQLQWSSMDWSQGCQRNNPLNCPKDGFIKFSGLKLPDTTNSWVNKDMNLKECRGKCMSNCSCMAYSNTDVRGQGSGCAIWFDHLMDIRQIPGGGGQDLYIRMPDSELGKHGGKVKKAVMIVAAVIGSVSVMLLLGYCIYRRRCLEDRTETITQNGGQEEEDLELPLFSFSTINTATGYFSVNNKLGEGGFGPVYRGKLEDGQEIAVKRLSMSSGQGINEFKNEVKLIAKLQHRNLVKLLGCCIQGEENLLVYEYMPNRSLDSFIYDQKQGKILDWLQRFQIISGIARGLVYLHQDSRLRIIHRDLKASNVLLDNEMNPKISDFGLARIFGRDQIEERTSRVIGTYGYMAPEYISDGLFSIKSDVFSFGILVLEIVSGKKNRGFPQENHGLTLTKHAWTLVKEGRSLEFLDKCLISSYDNLDEMSRCIHIGLLCVQQSPMDRPSMPSVVLMLGSQSELPEPKPPGYFMDMDTTKGDYSSTKPDSSLTNNMSISLIEPR
ncbi:S-receptor-like serine/threonine-protein kinase [Parasponia andersonii]|uniref:Receptor-like serine/threonine-protein kinase n=1 Tax=Parasponia andersonii TaxID=3476 RepID=A0A2P5BW31_PARAD|nr:S-receptor-like serine/threonine-protein kinase [Parasponia andersonii]